MNINRIVLMLQLHLRVIRVYNCFFKIERSFVTMVMVAFWITFFSLKNRVPVAAACGLSVVNQNPDLLFP